MDNGGTPWAHDTPTGSPEMIPMTTLNHREIAILDAVRAGRATMLVSCCPDLAVDGGWCDHTAVAHLVDEGLVASAPGTARFGDRVLAVVTENGLAALREHAAA